MNRSDETTRRATTALVAAVGLFAGGDSYTHIYSLARQYQGEVSAALLPLAGDGLVIASSWVMLAAAKQGTQIPARARITFWAGVAATVAANGAFGYSHGITAALLSLWPVLAYLGCMEMLTWLQANLGMQPVKQPRRTRAASGLADADAPGLPQPDAGDELKDRRDLKEHQSLAELLAAAEKRFPDFRTAGKMPTLRAIQTALSVGQPKAYDVQNHFRASQTQ